MGGVCGKWLNMAYDYALQHGKLPVRFRDSDGVLNDLLPEFTASVWVKYVTLMVRIRTPTHVYGMHVYG